MFFNSREEKNKKKERPTYYFLLLHPHLQQTKQFSYDPKEHRPTESHQQSKPGGSNIIEKVEAFDEKFPFHL